MTSAVLPFDAPPRLWRFAELPHQLVSTWDPDTNVQVIDRDKFDALSSTEQHILWRTDQPKVYAIRTEVFSVFA